MITNDESIDFDMLKKVYDIYKSGAVKGLHFRVHVYTEGENRLPIFYYCYADGLIEDNVYKFGLNSKFRINEEVYFLDEYQNICCDVIQSIERNIDDERYVYVLRVNQLKKSEALLYKSYDELVKDYYNIWLSRMKLHCINID